MAGVECDPDQLQGLNNAGINLIRTGPVSETYSTPSSKSKYDQARFQLAVSETPQDASGTDLTDKPLGSLFVSYKVRLLKPRLGSVLGRGALQDIVFGSQIADSADPTTSSSFNLGHNDGWPRVCWAANETSQSTQQVQSALLMRRFVRSNIGCEFVFKRSNTPLTDPDQSDRVEVIFPSYLQGLVRVKFQFACQVWSGIAASQVPGNAYLFWGDVRTAGNVSATKQVPLANSIPGVGSSYVDGDNAHAFAEANSYGLFNGTNNNYDRVFGHFSMLFRVSQPAGGETNSVVFKAPSTSLLPATGTDPQTLTEMESMISVEVVNDFEAVSSTRIGFTYADNFKDAASEF
jgi:hypothetical protein